MSTLDQKAINRHGWRVAFASGLASYVDAGAIAGTGTALVILQGSLGLTPAQVGQLSALLTIMIAAGALVGGRLGDRFGRRRVFLVTLSVFVVAALALMLAPSVALLYIGLAVLGLAAGADLPVSMAMIAESAPEDKRGKMVTFTHVLWMAGILGVIIISIFFGNAGILGAQIIYGHLAAVALIAVALRWGIPESRLWKESQNSPADDERVDLRSLRALFSPKLFAPLAATGLFYALVNIAANTNGQFSTYLFVNVAGVDVATASMLGLGILLLSVAGLFVMMRIVDGSRRHRTFVLAAVLALVGLAVPLVFGVTAVTLVVMGVFGALGGAVAGEPMYKIWSQELFPTSHRSTAQGITIAFARLVAAGAALVTPLIIAAGPALLFLFLIITSGAAYLIGIFWIFRMRTFLKDDGAMVTAATAPQNVAG
ncbi:MFS transporter [Arthrobacter sp. Alg241-R88]|jgi:MFS transporter, SP family, inositol transporter|uniref:MFS transporter n=1 Tax=Arthrobacter sp. Alg241-R88 TaxID=2305984 RepID=UPI0013D5DCA2|nr:MFS transporter [Arthrobacter sp. Alg241-R88]